MKLYPVIFAIIISVLLCFTCHSMQAQNMLVPEGSSKEKSQSYQMGHYLNNRLNLKIGYKYKYGFNIELNYAFLNILEVGLYTGIDRYFATPDPDSMRINDQGKPKPVYGRLLMNSSPYTLLMGVNLNIHILPLFIKKKDLRFDLYISNKFYTGYAFLPQRFTFKTRFLPFHAETGLGFSCYFTKRWGMYIEGSYQYQNPRKADHISSFKYEEYFTKRGVFHGRIGFTFRFNK